MAPHQWAWDLRAIESLEHRRVVWGALGACDYPFKRIRRATGRRVPVGVRDLSPYAVAGAHAHIHDEQGNEAHVLAEQNRRGALGLYWLPTSAHPAGRVELEVSIMGDVALAQEVFLAEAAHAVDFGVPLTDEQRRAIFAILHGGDASAHADHGWWEEHGSGDYWAWVGESFMGLFMGAFAPTLPRPLQARQPWKHPPTDEMYPQVRAVLL